MISLRCPSKGDPWPPGVAIWPLEIRHGLDLRPALTAATLALMLLDLLIVLALAGGLWNPALPVHHRDSARS